MGRTVEGQANKPTIEELRRYIGAVVSLDGFVETVRDQKRMQFLSLNSHGSAVQIAHERGTKTTASLSGSRPLRLDRP
jgi:aspartyl/asparaginyl-tRNA synthetase